MKIKSRKDEAFNAQPGSYKSRKIRAISLHSAGTVVSLNTKNCLEKIKQTVRDRRVADRKLRARSWERTLAEKEGSDRSVCNKET